MRLLQLQQICLALVLCLQGDFHCLCNLTALISCIYRCLDLGAQPFKCNHELMIRGKRCCIFAYAQTNDTENPALLGCCCPIDGIYPATLIKSGSKDNDLLRQSRESRLSARGVNYQTVNVNDDFWDNWARRQGCSLQVVSFACADSFACFCIMTYPHHSPFNFCSHYWHWTLCNVCVSVIRMSVCQHFKR